MNTSSTATTTTRTTPIPFIDGHCHLDDPRFDVDRDQVVAAAREAGLDTLIIPGVRRESWSRSAAIANKYDFALANGLHPYWSEQHQPGDLLALEDRLGEYKAIAIGECGLDYRPSLAPDKAHKARQMEFFTAQLDMAVITRLPVIIHATAAVDEVTRQLRQRPGLRAQIHSFSGSLQQAHKLLDLGALLSFSANITHPRAQRQQRLIRELPLHGMAFETDAPDQPGHAHLHQRNQPGWLPDTFRVAARLRSVALDKMIQHSNQNLCELFALAPPDRNTANV